MTGDKANMRSSRLMKVAASALAACVLAGGASAAAELGFASSPPPDGPAPAQTAPTSDAASSTLAELPTIGDVIIEHGRYGTVIIDRATHGKQFSLAGFQAGECLSYVKANLNPSAADVRAACPGQHSG
jgi:hypothetical protein